MDSTRNINISPDILWGQLEEVQKAIRKIAPTDITILMEGETGTGKRLVAKVIHALSSRRGQPFIPVNCAAIPKELMESELFGHERYVFQAGMGSCVGKFQLAHGGTIFLDEIGDMGLELQAKILRVLEEKEIQRVGGTNNIRVDVRVIATTKKDLSQPAKAGKFRQELYYRLNVLKLRLPPLRQRKEDILPLAEHFLAGRVKNISVKARRLLVAYDWPGNVRELKNCMERAVVLGNGKTIQPQDLPQAILQSHKVIQDEHTLQLYEN
jgi:DNA-binding NtrC family response regulator